MPSPVLGLQLFIPNGSSAQPPPRSPANRTRPFLQVRRLARSESGYAYIDSPAQLVAPSHASSGSGLPFEAFERRYSNDSISLAGSRLRSDDFPALDGSPVRAVLRLRSDDSGGWHADLCSAGRHPGDGGRLPAAGDRGRLSAGRRRVNVRGRHAQHYGEGRADRAPGQVDSPGATVG